jgi:LacI family transcriptional regulator
LNGLSKKYRISTETEDQVIKVARQLNYRPNLAAVNFRLKKTNNIGLLIPSLANPFFANVASHITSELHTKGYSVIISDCGEDDRIEAEMLTQLADRRMDGLLISPASRKPTVFESLYRSGLPIVFFDRYFEDCIIPYVSTHNYQGAYEITKYLIQTGHRRIACIQATHDVMPVTTRLRGYVAAMREAGLSPDCVGTGFSLQNGYIETKLLLSRAQKPTAIFAFTNPIALGTIKALREEGINIPGEVSLVTFDDSEYLNFLDPPVTCVEQPLSEMARISVKILLQQIEGHEGDAMKNTERILLSPRIIYRQSTQIL